MAKRILCFGDSNTYGYDPRDPFGWRYPPEDRWTDLLGKSGGYEVINQGENGRSIPAARVTIQRAISGIAAKQPLDLLILMLGTNDVLLSYAPDTWRIAARMDVFVEQLRENFPALPILLIAPPQVQIPDEEPRQILRELAEQYEAIAARHGTFFVSALDWDLPLAADEVHFTPEAHHAFARILRQELEKLL